jgi:Domain of unknown function (DUF4352)/Protein of unknown function (DUF2510)
VTTPPTPAGWYPDPDGSGGQRYWDGSRWTEHQSPATPEPAEPLGSDHSGAHRAPDPEPEPTPEPEPGPTAVIKLDSVPSEQPTSPVIPQFDSPPAAPPTPEREREDTDRRKLILRFGAACAALLAVLVIVVIYGVFINKNDSIQVSRPSTTSESATPTTSSGNGRGGATETASESPTVPSGSGPQASDGGLTFAVTGVETAPSIKFESAPVEKNAQGEFFIVHMTVLNSGDAQATYVGMFQKLKAGDTAYSIDDVATAYLNGISADLNPGDTADVAIAFDVPPGTAPESLEVHAEPGSTGADVPLS